jgi:hypothetical protein
MATQGQPELGGGNPDNTSDDRFMPGATDVHCLLIVIRFECLRAPAHRTRGQNDNR